MDICRDIMTYFLAARDSNGGDWYQYLPIIIIGILWIAGVISRALQNKSAQDDEKAGAAEDQPVDVNLSRLVELARRRYISAGATAEQPPKQQQGPAVVPPVIPPKEPPRPGSRAAVQQSTNVYTDRLRKKTTQKPLGGAIEWAQPDITPLSELSEPTFKNLSAAHKVQASRRRLNDIMRDFSGRDSLKRAILHYEILGKCAAMRHPQASGIWT